MTITSEQSLIIAKALGHAIEANQKHMDDAKVYNPDLVGFWEKLIEEQKQVSDFIQKQWKKAAA